jgi:trans-aconitate methyltransferase
LISDGRLHPEVSDNTPPRSGDTQWDPDAYDGAHSFVYEYGADVLELLDPQPDERILDLGCGTGHLTARIAERAGEVVGLDRDGEMLREARAAHPDLRFVRADARSFAFDGAFDAVFSNAALHWIPASDQAAVADRVAEALYPGGRFVAELGGVGNVSAIVAAVRTAAETRGYAVDNPWYFPTIGEHASLLEAHGFEVESARLFDRPTDLEDGEAGMRNWIGMFGDTLLSPIPADERAAVVAAAEDRLREDLYRPADDTWIADYRRLRFRAVRTE